MRRRKKRKKRRKEEYKDIRMEHFTGCVHFKANKEFGSLRNEGKKEFGSPKNEENKTAKNEMNEVFGEKDEGQHNKSFHINRKESKDNSKKTSRG